MRFEQIKNIKLNPDNPRFIKDANFKKLVQSIKDFPEMLELRPIVVDENMVILGGNMRYRACIEVGLKEVYIIAADRLTEEQKKEFLIKDNVSGGEWDWEVLANEWNTEQLEAWGLDVENPFEEEFLNEIEDDFSEIPKAKELNFCDKYIIIRFKNNEEYENFVLNNNVKVSISPNFTNENNAEVERQTVFDYEDLCSIQK
jgi:hypothetical protein